MCSQTMQFEANLKDHDSDSDDARLNPLHSIFDFDGSDTHSSGGLVSNPLHSFIFSFIMIIISELGDKTLLDSLIPIRDTVRDAVGKDIDAREVLKRATEVANEAIERTKPWVAKRGRQQFTGDRSANTPDPGVVAIATMMNDLCTQFGVKPGAAGKAH